MATNAFVESICSVIYTCWISEVEIGTWNECNSVINIWNECSSVIYTCQMGEVEGSLHVEWVQYYYQ